MSVCLPSSQHLHLRRAALPRSPVQPRLRAQNDLRRLAALLPGLTLPVTGAFKLEPVLALIRLRPFAVSPPFLDLQPFLMPQPFIAPFFLLAIATDPALGCSFFLGCSFLSSSLPFLCVGIFFSVNHWHQEALLRALLAFRVLGTVPLPLRLPARFLASVALASDLLRDFHALSGR